MEEEKIILLFSDLEGTILRELDGKYSDEDMYMFLQQLDELQNLTNARVKLHLVSPVYKDQMEKIVEQIDKNIYSYNNIHKQFNRINTIECAAAYPEDDLIGDEFTNSKVIPLKKPVSSKEYDTAKFGKSNYVKKWIDLYNEDKAKNLIMTIYCGNGRNDLDAMNYIKDRCKGIVICPKNSRTQAKGIASFVSEKTDLLGITDGINQLSRTFIKSDEEKNHKTNQSELNK